MVIISSLLNIIAVIAIIVFIVYTIIVHRRIISYIKTLEDNLKDYQTHLDVDIKFRDNINDAVNTCSKLITLCNNTNLEVISKLKNGGKDRDNKYNSIVSRITELNNLVIKTNKLLDNTKSEANKRLIYYNLTNCPSAQRKRNSKLKTAKNKEV